ncbi:MAG: bacteriohemerythrin [Magnetococcales bacterium]|nr:bacteriohemerythrin [Magnetococcales bacterium]
MDKIIKTGITRGMFWIEVPEAGLRVLCGCPGDSVKHLIKRGLIVTKEKNGVVFETGPNAILLSDVMVQNGEFSNLAEFPVLQMLYKQGLILPNHPNNSGEKPLLIGMPEQVTAQLQYIYRGNYGLVSREEIMKTGMDRVRADEIMRMKLRFAFGRILPTSAFLDTRLLAGEHEPVAIRNGVSIKRKSTNIFEFEYRGETVAVDLNLKEGDRYPPPYPLGFQKIKREYFGVIHSGDGDGWDTNRPGMSSILMFQGRLFLIDAGPNLAINLAALGIGLEEIEGVFLTHIHDDHFAGITTLLRAGHKIKFYSTRLVRATAEKKVAALLSMEEERFRDYFEIHDLALDAWNNVDGLEVKPILSPHPVETTILLFRALWVGGHKTYAHYADIVSLDILEGMVTEDDSKNGVTRALFEQVRAEYLQPVDIKKIDIGGGMIHGVARDFLGDRSGKLLLSHTSQEPTAEEKRIGSSASHGTADILIPAATDFSRHSAFGHLRSYLPDAPFDQIRILLNCRPVFFNPGEIILKEGEVPAHILLILSGMVESIHATENTISQLSVGTLVGEMVAMHHLPVESTIRASGYVQALEIPSQLYIELIERNDLFRKLERTWDLRSFLLSTSLFGEGVSHPVLGRIVDTLEIRRCQAGDLFTCRDLGALNMVRSGRFARLVGGETIDILGEGDFFGEEGAVFNIPCLFRVQAIEAAETLQISGELVKDIPIVRWKLFESYLKRAQRIVYSGKGSARLAWKDEFGIHNAQMDTHHKKLVEIANSIIEIVHSSQDRNSLERAFEGLVDYTHYHFASEENLMEEYGYPELERHRAIHRALVSRVLDYREEIASRETLDGVDFESFFRDWIVGHILNEDRKYSVFLNERCVF